MATDFSSIISGSGIALEQQAYNMFGAATEQFSTEALGRMSGVFDGSFGENPFVGGASTNQAPGSSQGFTHLYGSQHEWNSTPYAMDLINYQPKHRFLFKVMFETYDSANFGSLFGNTSADKNGFQYVVKHIDKPTVSFEYEDVNYYNFRTKVLKFIRHDALSMTMIDDINNTFHNFFTGYLKAHSPIASSYNPHTQPTYDVLKSNGFNFNDFNGDGDVDSAIRGLLPGNNYNILSNIRIFQYFAHGMKVNVFRFVNPRIIDFNFEEASHEGSDQGNHCTIRFDYDALYIEPARPVSGPAEYPAPMTDMFINGGGISGLTGVSNPWLNQIASGLGQQAGSILQGMTNQALSGVAGSNPLTQGIMNQTSHAIGNVGRNTVFGMTTGQTPETFSLDMPYGSNAFITEDIF